MSFLEKATIPEDGPVICTLASDPGMGKSSLAALFPNPIFMCAEDGLQRVDKSIRPMGIRVQTVDDCKAMLTAVLRDEHDYKTLVIDSVTALEALFIKHIIDNDPKKPASINQAAGGYGNGPKAVGYMHENIKNICKKIADERDMNIVFIAHADTESLDLPDKDPYMRYSFRLGKHSLRPYVDEVNLVGFIRMEIFLKGAEDDRVKKARTSGDRILECVPNAWSIAKNGYQIKEPLVFPEGVNPLVDFIPRLKC